MKIAVFGAGYVGLSQAAVLSRFNMVYVVDVIEEKIAQLSRGECPIEDTGMVEWLAAYELDLHPTMDAALACEGAEFIVVAVPTSYSAELGHVDTSIVRDVIENAARLNPEATIVVKSTIPAGFTDQMCVELPQVKLLFSPEFLREGKALADNAHPSRVIVGVPERDKDDPAVYEQAELFARLLVEGSLDEEVPTVVMGAKEAETVKLFANTYLAMRVAFFNELDTFATTHGLDAGAIVHGISYDPRIGDYYNNPSFGYGGYCLPKDSKQLLADFAGTPQRLISAIVESNDVRKDYVADQIVAKLEELRAAGQPSRVGIYRLVMKKNADNFRSSSIQGIIERLQRRGVDLLLFEPGLHAPDFLGVPVVPSVEDLKRDCSVIVANRMDDCLTDIVPRVYTCDLFGRD